MSSPFFFGPRENLFRPLAGKRRAKVLACLAALYDRVFGPGADYFLRVNHEALKALFSAILAGNPDLKNLSGIDDDKDAGETYDLAREAALIIRQLREDGWLETYYDRLQISEAYRFTRHGKLLTEVLLKISRPASASRHRNMRACRNALAGFLESFDPHELVDAYEAAQNVIEDLTENIGLIYEHARTIVQEAAKKNAWGEFDAFLKRFEQTIRPQLTSEHVNRHLGEIRERCRQARKLDPALIDRIEEDLNTLMPWASERRSAHTTYAWVLGQVEDLVEGACIAKQPELQRAITEYTRSITNLLRDVMSIRLQSPGASVDALLKVLAELDPVQIDEVLDRLGWELSTSSAKLIDPGTIRVSDAPPPTRISTKLKRHTQDPGSAKQSAIAQALSGAFSLGDREATAKLQSMITSGPRRVSELPTDDAISILIALHAPDIARTGAGAKLFEVKRLPGETKNRFFTAPDYLIYRKE